ncbi:conserved hypothetical protein [Neospora caninum Liverpool]|uniref:Transmembrane protein n=1 Tax=Neospora caninum (strain Liverpool) TaxID=572307 RepID=F0VC02_NEOCL|nr:conserved hypothetical protein [Neospora caninum Liverpool]CBZ51136.1 conserved hypothetical protein [Neospora caninum Liverpool]CEL68444.1 TPA: hypothetical protein BN1204_042110 [Neospora caninum Liverpool]|eukprot:XP_003881169.1 conserved hypothetical protein [Neospora caninum Liverpool]
MSAPHRRFSGVLVVPGSHRRRRGWPEHGVEIGELPVRHSSDAEASLADSAAEMEGASSADSSPRGPTDHCGLSHEGRDSHRRPTGLFVSVPLLAAPPTDPESKAASDCAPGAAKTPSTGRGSAARSPRDAGSRGQRPGDTRRLRFAQSSQSDGCSSRDSSQQLGSSHPGGSSTQLSQNLASAQDPAGADAPLSPNPSLLGEASRLGAVAADCRTLKRAASGTSLPNSEGGSALGQSSSQLDLQEGPNGQFPDRALRVDDDAELRGAETAASVPMVDGLGGEAENDTTPPFVPASSMLDHFDGFSEPRGGLHEESEGSAFSLEGEGEVGHTLDGEGSETISRIQQLDSIQCVKRPLGAFEETLTYMKFREFVRRHHGVFGTTSVGSCIWWILGCQFLVITVALMTCHADPASNSYRRSFIDVSTTVGRVCIYFFSSLILTLILALKFGGPLMLMWSVRLSKLACATLLILAPAIQIRESSRGDLICATVLYIEPLQLNGMVLFNGIFTQLQLFMFVCSTINCLFWARLHAYWFQCHSVKLWQIVKKEKIQLQIPQPIEKALHSARPASHRDLADGRVINADGEYIEVHGFSFTHWLRRLLVSMMPGSILPANLKPSVSVVFYVGQVDERGLPHGFGRWRSEAYHGESIVGYWDHGIPVGPFKSREFGTGSGFMCIRIAWCKVAKGPLRPEMQLGIGDAECCVSGAFFRTFPRVTLYPLRAKHGHEIPSSWSRHGLDEAIAKETKGATVGRLSHFSYMPEGNAIDESRLDRRTGSVESSSNVNLASRTYGDLGARGSDDFMGDIGGRLQRMRGSVIQRAHMFFKRRSERCDGESRAAFFKECQRLCLSRMVPHLPNFGLLFTTELHITVDPERGLYIAGWVPESAVLPVGYASGLQSRVPLRHTDSDPEHSQNQGREDEDLLAEIREQRDKQKARQMSESQLRARGLHQRFGLALHGPEMIMRKVGKGALRNTVVGGVFYERPRIRRQTYDGESKSLVVRILDKRKRGSRGIAGGFPSGKLRSAGSAVTKTLKHAVSCSPNDPLAPDDDPMKGFSWITSAPELHIDGWRRAEVAGIPEALIFIHGYNTNHVQSLQIMAQMLSFGNFPSYIKPFLFTWPAGRNFTEFFEARDNANNPKIQECFHEFIVSLRDNGIRQIHIMAHSLGSRLLMNSLRGMAEFTFSKSLDTENDDKLPAKYQDRMQLVSLIFLNPEFFLDDFVLQEYSFLRQYCSNISLFCDAHDGALWWSELFSGRQALGRSVFGLYTRPREDEPVSEETPKLPPVFAETMACFQGYEPDYLKSDTREWLDLDVIDMTWLGHNVHSMRHSYWPLNREIIEDIRELVVTRKRARQRTSRLDRREGNVWVYRVAPSSLTSIFDSDL